MYIVSILQRTLQNIQLSRKEQHRPEYYEVIQVSFMQSKFLDKDYEASSNLAISPCYFDTGQKKLKSRKGRGEKKDQPFLLTTDRPTRARRGVSKI